MVTDVLMKLATMEMRKSVDKVSRKQSTKSLLKEKIFLLPPNFGTLTTEKSTLFKHAKELWLILDLIILIFILFISQFLLSLFHLKQDIHPNGIMTQLIQVW